MKAIRRDFPFLRCWRGSALPFHSCISGQLHEREAAASQLTTQNVRFNAALNNMAQGLCMFDANRKLVICNERYAAMYALPPELVRPGTAHEDIIRNRVAQGILAGEKTDSAASEKLADLGRHATDKISESALTSWPMAG